MSWSLGVGAVLGAMRRHATRLAVQIAGCRALLRIAATGAGKRAVVNYRGTSVVVAAMQRVSSCRRYRAAERTLLDAERTLLQNGCSLLWRLADGDEACKLSVLEAGGAQAVVHAMRKHSGDARMQGSGSLSLWALARAGDSCRGAVLEAGGPQVVVQAMQRLSANPEVQYSCCFPLLALARSPEARAPLVQAGAVGAIVGVLTRHAADARVRKHCFALLQMLATCSARESWGDDCLRASVHSEMGSEGGRRVLCADCALCGEALASGRAAGALLTALRHCATEGEERESLLFFVASMFERKQAVEGCVSGEAAEWVANIVGGMRACGGNSGVQFASGMTLSELLRLGNGESRSALVSCGGLEVVIEQMKTHIERPEVQTGACRVLLQVLKADGMAGRIYIAGGLEAVVDALRRHPRQYYVALLGIQVLGRMVAECGEYSAGERGKAMLEAIAGGMRANEAATVHTVGVWALGLMCDVDHERKAGAGGREGARKRQKLATDTSLHEEESCSSRPRTDMLKALPCMLLAQLWPPKRVLMGRRVCRWLKHKLGAYAVAVVMQVKPERVLCPGETLTAVAQSMAGFSASAVTLRCSAGADDGHGGERMPTATANILASLRKAAVAIAPGGCIGAQIRRLELRESGLGDEQAELLGGVVQECRALERLDVSGNTLRETGAVRLCLALRHTRLLCELDVHHNAIGDRGAEALSVAMLECPALVMLDASSNAIGEDGVSALAAVLGGCHALEVLKLRRNGIGHVGARALAQALPGCRSLTALDVFAAGLGASGVAALADCVEKCGKLRRLEVGGHDGSASSVGVGPHAVRTMERCAGVQYVDLSFCRVGVTLGGRVADMLRRQKGVQHLDLRGNALRDGGVGALAAVLGECEGLASLWLSGNGIGPAGMSKLAHALRFGGGRELRQLQLGTNVLGDEGAESLAGVLARGELWKIERVGLRQNAIGDAGARTLGRALRSMLERGRQGEGERRGCRVMAELDLRDNSIGDAGFGEVAARVVDGSLLRLAVNRNRVGGAGMRMLVQLLERRKGGCVCGGGEIVASPGMAVAEHVELFAALLRCPSPPRVDLMPVQEEG